MLHRLPKHCVRNLAKIITKSHRRRDKDGGTKREKGIFSVQHGASKLVRELDLLGGYFHWLK